MSQVYIYMLQDKIIFNYNECDSENIFVIEN